MADRRGARGGPSRTPATTPASCPPYLELRSRCLGSRRWRFDGSGFLRACVRKLRDILLGGRRTAGRLQIGPDLPTWKIYLRTHAQMHPSSFTMQSGPSTLVRCRNKFGNISKRKTSFPFPCRVGSTPAGWDGVQWAGQETDLGRWESGRRRGRRWTSRGSRSFWGSWRRPCRRCLRRRSPRARPRR